MGRGVAVRRAGPTVAGARRPSPGSGLGLERRICSPRTDVRGDRGRSSTPGGLQVPTISASARDVHRGEPATGAAGTLADAKSAVDDSLPTSSTQAYWPAFVAGRPRKLPRGDVRVRRLTKGYAAAVVLGAVTLLGACTTPPATDPPGTTSPTSASSSATAERYVVAVTSSSSSTSPAQIPEAAKVNSPQGAEAFTSYFGQTLDDAFATLNADALRALVLTDCKSCSGAISAVEGYGRRTRSSRANIAGITTATYSSTLDGVTKVLAQSRTERRQGLSITTARSSRPFRLRHGNLSVQLRFDGQWRVAEVQGVA